LHLALVPTPVVPIPVCSTCEKSPIYGEFDVVSLVFVSSFVGRMVVESFGHFLLGWCGWEESSHLKKYFDGGIFQWMLSMATRNKGRGHLDPSVERWYKNSRNCTAVRPVTSCTNTW
jgi:hypothetical protein